MYAERDIIDLPAVLCALPRVSTPRLSSWTALDHAHYAVMSPIGLPFGRPARLTLLMLWQLARGRERVWEASARLDKGNASGLGSVSDEDVVQAARVFALNIHGELRTEDALSWESCAVTSHASISEKERSSALQFSRSFESICRRVQTSVDEATARRLACPIEIDLYAWLVDRALPSGTVVRSWEAMLAAFGEPSLSEARARFRLLDHLERVTALAGIPVEYVATREQLTLYVCKRDMALNESRGRRHTEKLYFNDQTSNVCRIQRET